MPMCLRTLSHCQNPFGRSGMHIFIAGKILRRRQGPAMITTDCHLQQLGNLLCLARFDQRLKLFD